jgi:mannose-6-phosphate isomerase-like protein (cupin superfamily)
MKKLLRSEFVRSLFAIVVVIGLARLALAAEKKDARVTQVIKDVRLLTSKAEARPASVNDSVREGIAVKTGDDSRAELTFTDQTLARLGANTVFSYAAGGKDFDLTSGAILVCVPKQSGAAQIRTVAVTAGITGFTAMVEYHSKSWFKFIVLEGQAKVCLAHQPGDCVTLGPGDMLVLPPGARRFNEKKHVNLKKLINTAGLIQQKTLPAWAWDAILTEANNQQGNPPGGGYTDPTGTDTINQRAATIPTPRPISKPHGSPPG